MANDTKHFLVTKIPAYAPDDYKQNALQIARERAGRQLYDLLISQKLPCVVDIKEEIESIPNYEYSFNQGPYMPDETIRIEISFYEVQHRHTTIAHSEAGLSYLKAPRSLGLLERVKVLFLGKP
jgi:hypothetical protein